MHAGACTLVAVVMLVSSCATQPSLRFNGPGTLQDLAAARHQCIQETQQRVGQASSGAYVGQYGGSYGGSATSQVMPSCGALASCLAAKGYFRDPNGRLDATSMAVACVP